MILFIGSEDKGFFIEEVASLLQQEVAYTGITAHIQAARDKAIEQNYDYIVVDIEQFLDEPDEIGQTLANIQRAVPAPVIILAKGYSRNSRIIQALLANGVQKIIDAPTPARQRKQLENCINGQGEMELAAPDNTQPEASALQPKKFKTIALCGVCHRIGTTTQAFQIIKYLAYHGRSACYIQMHDSKFVEQVSQIYSDAKIDLHGGKVIYQGIDMFYQQEKIAAIQKMPYDYFVYDYGCFGEPSCNPISFLERDIPIVVCGAFPSEWDYTNAAIYNNIMQDVSYIFSFCDPTEQKDILEFMADKADRTYFADYCPDFCSFTANSAKLYDQLIALENLNGSRTSKKGWFRRKKKGK